MKRRYWIALAFVVLASPVAWQAWNGNFHPVVAGEVYRSAQPTPDDIAGHVRREGIRSVLNLRGADPGKEWYDDELAASRAHGLTHADFLMTASSPLNKRRMDQLIELMQTLPKPLLIHCWGGADRTGLASALYLYSVQHRNAEEAGGQLSIRFGHVPYLFWQKTEAMDDSFKLYVDSMKEIGGAGAAAVIKKE